MSAVDVTNFDSDFTSVQNPWVYSGSGGWASDLLSQTTYRLRAYDSGTAGYVYWTNTGTSPDLSPLAADTTPNYTGSLSLKSIL